MNPKIYFMVIKLILLIIQVSECIIDTCPRTEITSSSRVANMCQTTRVKDDQDGNDNFDSVFLSLLQQEDNCSCTVSLKNTNHFVNLFIKRLNNLTEQPLCGMEIDIYLVSHQENIILNRSLTRCDNKETTISVSILGHEYLQFISRVVDGHFSIGYCIQIGIVPMQGEEYSYIDISCSGPVVTTPLDIFTQPRTTLNDLTTFEHLTPMFSSSTAMIDTSQIHNKADSDGDSTLFIALGTVLGFIICVSLLVVILLCKRQLSIKAADPADNRSTQYDSLSESRNTLNYSTLNRTSKEIDEQQYEIVTQILFELKTQIC